MHHQLLRYMLMIHLLHVLNQMPILNVIYIINVMPWKWDWEVFYSLNIQNLLLCCYYIYTSYINR